MTNIVHLLTERGNVHGDYKEQSKIAQRLVNVMIDTPNWSDLPPPQWEALNLMAIKIARILAGDPNFKDHWVDIQGYAKCALDALDN
jgi:hypothetical protein